MTDQPTPLTPEEEAALRYEMEHYGPTSSSGLTKRLLATLDAARAGVREPEQAQIEAAIADISEEWAESAEWLARMIVENIAIRNEWDHERGVSLRAGVREPEPGVPDGWDSWTHALAAALYETDPPESWMRTGTDEYRSRAKAMIEVIHSVERRND